MTTYHAPYFDPTVDDIETLKQLEMGQVLTVPHAIKEHVSARLLEWGVHRQKPRRPALHHTQRAPAHTKGGN